MVIRSHNLVHHPLYARRRRGLSLSLRAIVFISAVAATPVWLHRILIRSYWLRPHPKAHARAIETSNFPAIGRVLVPTRAQLIGLHRVTHACSGY